MLAQEVAHSSLRILGRKIIASEKQISAVIQAATAESVKPPTRKPMKEQAATVMAYGSCVATCSR